MTPTTISGLAQTLPLLSNAKPDTSPQEEKGSASLSAAAAATKESPRTTVDTVSISYQSRLAATDVKKEESLLEKATKQEAQKDVTDKVSNSGKADGAIAKVQFVYNMKGDLSMRYMDTANRLIYQVPSELMLRLKEALTKSAATVDTKA